MDVLQAAAAQVLNDAGPQQAAAPVEAPVVPGANPAPPPPGPAQAPVVPEADGGGLLPPTYEITSTYKGKEAIVKDGYVYIVKDTHGNNVYWRCIQCNKLKCKAGGKTQGGSRELALNDKVNNHDPDETEIKARQLVVKARAEAKAQRLVPAANIVDHLLQGASQDVALAVSRDNLLRVANRAKRQDGSQMVNRPPQLIQWPEHFKTTATGERFLLYDSRDHEADQPVIFIFASAAQLQYLRDSPHWSGDGTFWCCPTGFAQLYTLHATIEHSSVPAAYILTPDMTEATYVRAMRALLQHGDLDGISPASVMHDFELAAINAMRAVFPDALIRLCLFHFAQALWRNVAQRGLTQLYRENEKARELIRCFGALALLPPADVVKGLEAIVAELLRLLRVTREIPAEWEAPLAGFENYVEETYIRRLGPGHRNFLEPRFRPAMWNCYHAVLDGLHRTNNSAEGWHYEFNNTFSSAHMAMDKFLERLKLDEDKNRQRVIRHEAFRANPLRSKKRPKYLQSDKHILAIARKYTTHYRPNGQILRYLRCMQYHLVKARFPGDEEEADDPLQEAEDDDDGGEPPEGEDNIPLNESHPGVDSDDNDDEAVDIGGNHEAAPGADGDEQGGPVALGGNEALANDQDANATQDDLPGFSQAAAQRLVPDRGWIAASVAKRRRTTAAANRTSW